MAAVLPRALPALLIGLFALVAASQASAAEKLRVGKAIQQNFSNLPLNIGMKNGFFAAEGLDIEEINFTGGAKLAQAMVADAADIGLGAGTDMAFTAKGAPQIAVATIVDSMAFMAFAVGKDSTARGIDDLKGKKIGVTTPGSLTYWLVDELNRVKGWTAEGDRAIPIVIGGAPSTAVLALRTGQIDAHIGGLQVGYQLEEKGEGRLLFTLPEYVKDIELFVTFASATAIKRDPGAVQRFLKVWYKSVDYMKSHKVEAVDLAVETVGYTHTTAERMYQGLITQFSPDGRFRPAALKTLFNSFVDLKILDSSVDMSKLYTEEFLSKN